MENDLNSPSPTSASIEVALPDRKDLEWSVKDRQLQMLSFSTEKRVGRGRTEEKENTSSHQYSAKLGKSCQSWRPPWIKDKTLALMFCPQFVQT